MRGIIVDTSGLISAVNDRSASHRETVALLDELGRTANTRFFISPFILAEVDYLLSDRERRPDIARRVLRDVADGRYRLETFDAEDMARAVEVIEQYSDQDIGVADASNAVLAERHGTLNISPSMSVISERCAAREACLSDCVLRMGNGSTGRGVESSRKGVEDSSLPVVGQDAEMPATGAGYGAEVALVGGEDVEAVVFFCQHDARSVREVEGRQVGVAGEEGTSARQILVRECLDEVCGFGFFECGELSPPTESAQNEVVQFREYKRGHDERTASCLHGFEKEGVVVLVAVEDGEQPAGVNDEGQSRPKS